MAKRKATNPEIWKQIKEQAERENLDAYDLLKDYIRFSRGCRKDEERPKC